MPMIHIEYDDVNVAEGNADALSRAVCDIVSKATGIDDVFVYANAARIKVHVAPIEIFVRMTAAKIKDEDALMDEIKTKLAEWKASTGFRHPINLTLIPMNWKIEIGI